MEGDTPSFLWLVQNGIFYRDRTDWALADDPQISPDRVLAATDGDLQEEMEIGQNPSTRVPLDLRHSDLYLLAQCRIGEPSIIHFQHTA
ncbi:hypothetical protein SCUP234_12197 [Seiridium cupressi]